MTNRYNSAAMEKAVCARAPAKVNLHLRVFGKRKDGFHSLRSIFQAISLADDVVVRSLTQPDLIQIDGVFDCPPEKTTFYQGIVAFREATGIRTGVSVKVTKAIPVGGGLGGGSSDAAALLLALDSLFSAGLSLSSLETLGARVGSDVPFFLHGGAALVEGRGDLVQPLIARVDYGLVLVFPGFPMNTAAAFRLLDQERPDDSLEADPSPGELESAYRLDPRLWPFANSFEAPVAGLHPGIRLWLERLKESGALFARMSGSGSTLFGVYQGLDEAEVAAGVLKRLAGADILVCTAFPLAHGISLL